MDYYLKTTSKQAFISDLKKARIEIEMEGNYFQNQNIIIDWIGLIPNEIQNEDEELTYKEGQHLNIRSREPIDISKFENTENVYPAPPYRIFS
jgi:translation initiation factor IF-3